MAKDPRNMTRLCPLTGLALLLCALAASLPPLSSALNADEPVPMHVYRDPATGELVEVAEQLTGGSRQLDLDALYLQEEAPLRTTSRSSSADPAVIRKPKGGVRYSFSGVASGDGGAAASSGAATNHVPLHVFRDPATGELVESEERTFEKYDDALIGTKEAATAGDRDMLYMLEADPVRVIRKASKSSRQPRNGAKFSFNSAGTVTRHDGPADVSATNPTPASLTALDSLYLEEMAPLRTGRSASTASRAVTRKPRGGARLSISNDGAISSESSAIADQPLRVHRDPVSGKMVEVPVSPSGSLPDSEAAAALAKELDSLYLQESAPFRVRRSGRKNLGASSVRDISEDMEAPLHVYRDASGAVVAEPEVTSSASAAASATEAATVAEMEALYTQDSSPIRIRRRASPPASDATPMAPPLHVYRDSLSGELVEVPEQQQQPQQSKSASAAAALAAKLDAAYHDSAPVRVRRRTPNLGGRKSLDASRVANIGAPAAAAATSPDAVDAPATAAGESAASDNSTVADTVAALATAAGSSVVETPSDVVPVRAFRDAETGELVEEPELPEEAADDRQHQQQESEALHSAPGSVSSSSSVPSSLSAPSDSAADASLISELDSLYLHKSEPVRTYPSSRKATDGSSSNAAPVTSADANVVLAENSGAAAAAAAAASVTTTSGAGNRGPLRTPSGKTSAMSKSTLASILSSWTSSSSTSSSSTSRSEQRRRQPHHR